MIHACIYKTMRHDLIEVSKSHPVQSTFVVVFVLGVRNICLRRMRWNDGGVWSLVKKCSIEGSFWHDVVVHLPSGKKFWRWKEHWNVHAVLFEDAHH